MPSRSEPTIALLRAVNVAGHGKVSMADLRLLMEALGFDDGKTLLQSGNLIFRAGTAPGRGGGTDAALERRLETETAKRLALETEYFVRSAAEWQELVARNPFPAEAKNDPGHLVVMFLKQPVKGDAVAALQAAIQGREIVRGAGRQVYVTYPDGIGRSRLTNAVIEKKLGARSTGRNWNTVLKLLALVRA